MGPSYNIQVVRLLAATYLVILQEMTRWFLVLLAIVCGRFGCEGMININLGILNSIFQYN